MRKKIFSCSVFLFLFLSASAQIDTVQLEEVTVSAYFNNYSLWRLPASAIIIDSAAIKKPPGPSLVPVLNTIAGVRMEERSPGSYRLSIRGSLLRSPFGIRNVKIYMDEFPLTDAGGNTYLNLIDPNAINKIEIMKGPDGSLFGANSGGVVRMNLIDPNVDSIRVTGNVGTGSFGLFHENVKLERRFATSIFSLQEGIQHCDGYRRNSQFDRKYIQMTSAWNYRPHAQIRALFFFSDLNYQTPGGLTLQQWNDDPRDARLPTAIFPGAEEQKAGISNHTFYGGIIHDLRLGEHLRQVVALFGSHTHFENPFITNYEVRNETNAGFRTWLETSTNETKNIVLKSDFGIEAQWTRSDISNFGNRFGNIDTLQAKDRLDDVEGFVFTRFSLDIYKRWIAEVSASLNENHYLFVNDFPAQGVKGSRQFTPQLMPRFAFSWLLKNWIVWRTSVSRGYSPPTLAEIRSSDNIVNTDLEPESGWNYETGFRVQDEKGYFLLDISAFYYQLNHAIERRENAAGQEYFINAGGTDQPGIELQWLARIIRPKTTGWIRKLQINNATTYSAFTFRNYSDVTVNYSGNALPSVPKYVVVTTLDIGLPFGLYIFVLHNFTSSIPLNNSNTVVADAYHLVQLKMGWKHFYKNNFMLEFDAGADNLLNEKYSLGNDLNAVGGRYYNPAPVRNYFLSASFRFG